jgi:hypothetical protein
MKINNIHVFNSKEDYEETIKYSKRFIYAANFVAYGEKLANMDLYYIVKSRYTKNGIFIRGDSLEKIVNSLIKGVDCYDFYDYWTESGTLVPAHEQIVKHLNKSLLLNA